MFVDVFDQIEWQNVDGKIFGVMLNVFIEAICWLNEYNELSNVNIVYNFHWKGEYIRIVGEREKSKHWITHILLHTKEYQLINIRI